MTNDLLTVGTLSAAPGTKTRGTVPADLGTLTVDIPLTLVNGAHPGPRVLITAGVHGGEFTGIDAATRLASLLEPAQVHGQVIICPVANPPAVYQGRLGISPLDGVNINRVFPGDPDGGPTERLAAWLFAHLVDGADAYADLHAGGIDEVLRDFVGYRLTGDAQLDAKTATWPAPSASRTSSSASTPTAATATRPPPARASRRSSSRPANSANATRPPPDTWSTACTACSARSTSSPPTPRTAAPVREWVWAAGITSEQTGLWYPEFTAGDDVTEGQIIGHVIAPADGQEHKVHTPTGGRVFYGMHGLTVAPGTELAAIAVPRTPAR
jgi:predicted deacylase